MQLTSTLYGRNEMTLPDITKRIVSDLHHLGITAGDVIMVHSSFNSLGQYNLTPEIVVSALLAAIGTRGTLLMPALSYAQEPHHIHNVSDTPSNVGGLQEYFRLRKGTIRSVHPTHSVCGFGAAAKELLDRHQDDSTPCGPYSPFRRILDISAKIVMLGCGLRPNTTMHALEEIVEPPYLFGDFYDYQITTSTGEQYTKMYRRHGFQGWIQKYDRIELSSSTEMYSTGTVLDGKTYIINTQELKKVVLSKLRDDPLCFVERKLVEQDAAVDADKPRR
jgi:aminoglycoside 3-N-acetyltransferase